MKAVEKHNAEKGPAIQKTGKELHILAKSRIRNSLSNTQRIPHSLHCGQGESFGDGPELATDANHASSNNSGQVPGSSPSRGRLPLMPWLRPRLLATPSTGPRSPDCLLDACPPHPVPPPCPESRGLDRQGLAEQYQAGH